MPGKQLKSEADTLLSADYVKNGHMVIQKSLTTPYFVVSQSTPGIESSSTFEEVHHPIIEYNI